MEKDGIIRGTGNQLIDSINVRDGLLVLGATSQGDSHFAVEIIGPEGQPRELLVNTLGFYAGGRVIPVRAGAYSIQITASTPWELFVEQPLAEDRGAAPPIERKGTGDLALGPFALPTRALQAEVTHRGSSNIMVSLFGVDGVHRSLLTNEIGEYQGTTQISLDRDGAYFVDVRADGEWVLSIE